MKTTHTLLAILFTVSTAAHGQDVSAATGSRGLPVSGNLDYTFRYSQTAEFGGASGDWHTANASAQVDYANGKERIPFNLTYGGGYTWTITGPTYSTGLFQHLLVSQGLTWPKWNLTVGDDVSYRPQAPTTGFSGIPGTGEPIGGSGSAPPTSQSILTLNTHTVNSVVNGELQHIVNHAMSFNVGGGSELLRYPDGNGLDTNTQMANAGLTQRLDARNSLTGKYMFFQYGYPGHSLTFVTNSGLFGFTRQWNRKVVTDVSVGPQWVSSSNSTIVPSSTKVAANAAINYKFRLMSAGLIYSRQANGGAGYLLGSESNVVSGNFSQTFGKNLTIGLDGSYARMTGLQNNYATNARFGGAQVTKRLGRYFTAFASYTAEDQSSSSPLPANALSQLVQVVGFGIGYSPRETHLKH
jgi:hypothetical protein